MFRFIVFTILLFLAGTNHAASLHRFHSGDCPRIEPMANFNIDRFLGEWFVLENANDNGQVCLREEFNASQEAVVVMPKHDENLFDMARNELEPTGRPKYETEDDMKIMEKAYYVKRSYLPFGGRQIISETGKISFSSNTSQSEMEISLPYAETGMLNIKHYEVISTDYDRFALVWRCQKTIFGHRRSAQLMSRRSELDEKSQQELQSLIQHFEAQHDIKFTPVRQTNCNEVSALEAQESTSSTPMTKRPPSSSVADTSPIHTQDTNGEPPKSKNKKKLINIEIGSFQLSISYPFF